MDMRHIIIQEVAVLQHIKGLPAGTKTVIFEERGRADKWEVLVACAPQGGIGFLPLRKIFILKEDAEDFSKNFKPGTRMNWTLWNKGANDAGLIEYESEPERQAFYSVVRHSIDEGGASFRRGDHTLGLAHKLLAGMGIYPGCKSVVDFIGEYRMSEIKSRFKESWPFVAQMEYCAAHYDRNSAPFIAASCVYSFAMNDVFSSGYLLRDLEDLVSGVEVLALKGAENRRKSGKAGAVVASDGKRQRLEQVLTEMERLRKMPRYARVKPDTLARSAIDICRNSGQLELWKDVSNPSRYAAQCVEDLRASFEYRGRFLAMFPRQKRLQDSVGPI